jgi:hypothetical protein
MNITPPLATRPHVLDISDLSENWAAWGYKEKQHHLILVAFFESWKTVQKPNSDHYRHLAKVLNDHYRQAMFPSNAKEEPYVYWLAGPNRNPCHSFCDSHQYFNKRYLTQFGPLFDVASWLNKYRCDPDKAICELDMVRAARYQDVDKKDRANQRPGGRPKDQTVNTENDDVNSLRPVGNSAATALRRLRKDRPDLHARALAGEISANAAMIEAGFRHPRKSRKSTLKSIQRLWEEATPQDRIKIRDWILSQSE